MPSPDPLHGVGVSVVMPAHNEADLLEGSVDEVVAGVRARLGTAAAFEVLVVENGSTDHTRAVADRLVAAHPEVRALHFPTADYGAALRAGLLAARHELVVNFDVDYYDLDFLERACTRIVTEQAAIVVGSKRAPGSRDERVWPRRLVTWVFSQVLRVAFSLRVSDTHGMKAMARSRVVGLVPACRSTEDLFDTELVVRAQRAGLTVTELPVTAVERRPSRTPIVTRIGRSLWGLARLRVLLWRGDPPGARVPDGPGAEGGGPGPDRV